MAAFPFQALVLSLDLAITLGVVGGSPHMTHIAHPAELLEVSGYELRAIFIDNPGTFIEVFFLRPLKNDFHIPFRHRYPDLPVNEKATVAGA